MLVALHMAGISLPEWEIPMRKVKKYLGGDAK